MADYMARYPANVATSYADAACLFATSFWGAPRRVVGWSDDARTFSVSDGIATYQVGEYDAGYEIRKL